MAMELFMYLIYLAYMKNSIAHNLPLYSVPVMFNVAFGFFSPENARFCFLETNLKRATVTSRSMDVASFRFIVVPFIRDQRFFGTPQSAICRLSVGSSDPPTSEAMIDPAKQKYGCGVTFSPNTTNTTDHSMQHGLYGITL